MLATSNIATGEVIDSRHRRRQHQESLRSLDEADAMLPPGLGVEVHLVLDNDAAHKTPAVKRRFLRPPEYHLHFAPTCSSWMIHVEQFFGEIIEERTRRGLPRSEAASASIWSITTSRLCLRDG